MNDSEMDFVVQHEIIAAGLAALEALDPFVKEYLIGGAETETTILRNRAAIERRAFRPRVLADVSQLNVETKILNRTAGLPLFLAPVGALRRFHAEGSAAAAAAANNMQVPIFFGSLARQSPEEMRALTEHDAAYQLYVRGDENWVDEQVREIEDVGFDALCLTVDSAVYSRRERDMARRVEKSWRRSFTPGALTFQASFSWRDIARIRRNCKLPIILKGVASAADAQLAVDHGVDVVYVSNHGGRQLDHARGTLDALVEIAGAVSGQAKLFVDGGFMRGTDVLKALALGADAVGLGRLYCIALAAGGEVAVTRMLQIIGEEIVTALALLGVDSPAALSREHIIDEPYLTSQPHLLSAFPLLERDS